MFMNTMAVGPLEDMDDWVTGGATVAIERFWRRRFEDVVLGIAAMGRR